LLVSQLRQQTPENSPSQDEQKQVLMVMLKPARHKIQAVQCQKSLLRVMLSKELV
jgi:hypothetical protein